MASASSREGPPFDRRRQRRTAGAAPAWRPDQPRPLWAGEDTKRARSMTTRTRFGSPYGMRECRARAQAGQHRTDLGLGRREAGRLCPQPRKASQTSAFSRLSRRSGALEPASFRDRYQGARRTAQGHQSVGSQDPVALVEAPWSSADAGSPVKSSSLQSSV